MTRCSSLQIKGRALDWAVAQAVGLDVVVRNGRVYPLGSSMDPQPGLAPAVLFEPSLNPSQGWSLIVANEIDLTFVHSATGSQARCVHHRVQYDSQGDFIVGSNGLTLIPKDEALTGAMRCLVHKFLGAELDIPEELLLEAEGVKNTVWTR